MHPIERGDHFCSQVSCHCASHRLRFASLSARSLISAGGVCDVQVRRQGRCTSFHHGLGRVHARRRVMFLQVHCLAKHHAVACRFNSSRHPYPLLSLHSSPLTVRRCCEKLLVVAVDRGYGGGSYCVLLQARIAPRSCWGHACVWTPFAMHSRRARSPSNRIFSTRPRHGPRETLTVVIAWLACAQFPTAFFHPGRLGQCDCALTGEWCAPTEHALAGRGITTRRDASLQPRRHRARLRQPPRHRPPRRRRLRRRPRRPLVRHCLPAPPARAPPVPPVPPGSATARATAFRAVAARATAARAACPLLARIGSW